MNAFDYFLIAILAFSTISAFMRGFLLEIFSLIGLFAGILLAGWYYKPFASSLLQLIPQPAIAQVSAFLLIAIGVMLACGLTGKILRRTASTIGLSPFDRVFGALFGLLRGYLAGVAIVLAIAAFLPTRSYLENSRLTPYFLTEPMQYPSLYLTTCIS